MKRLLIIDTFNLLHRAYHALPATFTDKDGAPINAAYGVASMLINVLTLVKPDYAIAALDGMKPTFRSEEFTAYKAHRTEMEEALSSQIPKVFEIIDAFGVQKFLVEGYEADDVMGTVAKKFGHEGYEVILLSNDRDMWQLVNGHVLIMLPSTKGDGFEYIGEKEVVARMSFTPDKIPDYKGLRGDPSDNIPGVYGVGEVTAKKLIAQFGTIEEIYKHIAEVEPKTLQEKLANNAEQAVMSKKLATIITEVPLQIDLELCKYRGFNSADVLEILKKYNFKSLMRRLGFEVDEGKAKKAEEVSKDQLSLF
ncbi:MAG TPA: 5'-3' exonuclease H3TH domain-containing protein [Candidatus Saccharimonadales bacterium]|nr:5'-3' exonuclease H3TH domain-containing protein [Candidatus Saccharimonadales bacterium]